MIAVAEALELIDKHTTKAKPKKVNLEQALGKVLANPVQAPINMPPFRQSSMDGYALKLHDQPNYKVTGEIAAGKSANIKMHAGEAVRIFTGARVPNDADCVVMQEHTSLEQKVLQVSKIPDHGANIRPVGEQIKAGEAVLPVGTQLSEAGIGFLTGLGLTAVAVYKSPRVGILVTGNELQEAGKPLEEGQVYESNAISLKMALIRLGINIIEIHRVKDNLEETKAVIKNLLKNTDFLLISGGISVGDYDYVQAALEKNEVKQVFYKVNQKPGKPLWYGTKGDVQIFALPGNPGSSLSCFYVYVRFALRKWLGHQNYGQSWKKARLAEKVKNPFSKVLFLKATLEGGQLKPLSKQASSMLQSFALCNALLVVPEDQEFIEAGTEVEYILL